MPRTPTTALVIRDLSPEQFDRYSSCDRVACDIETSGLNPHVEEIGTVQIYDPCIGGTIIKCDPDQTPRRFIQLLQNRSVTKVFHHAPFDLSFIMRKWNSSATSISCTKVASKILEPNIKSNEHSLKMLLRRHLGVEISKDQQTSNWLSKDLSEDQISYALGDVEYLLPLYDLLLAKLRTSSLIDTYLACNDFLPTKVFLELGGWPDVFDY